MGDLLLAGTEHRQPSDKVRVPNYRGLRSGEQRSRGVWSRAKRVYVVRNGLACAMRAARSSLPSARRCVQSACSQFAFLSVAKSLHFGQVTDACFTLSQGVFSLFAGGDLDHAADEAMKRAAFGPRLIPITMSDPVLGFEVGRLPAD